MAGDRLRAVGVLGELLITLGVVLALFVVHQVWWTDLDSGRRQRAADDRLAQDWSGPAPDNPRGRAVDVGRGVAFARLYVPALGADYQFAVVRGTDEASLETGPGHYDGTQPPGAPGNFAVAGHRVGRGAPFNDLDAVDTCDALVVETRERWFVYRVLPVDAPDPAAARAQAGRCLPDGLAGRATSGAYAGLSGREIVSPSDASVVDPVPGDPRPADGSMLALATLTTCHPRYSAAERMVVHAVLVRDEPRTPGRVPAELGG